MDSEEKRLKTFFAYGAVPWPHANTPLTPERLSKAGFYFVPSATATDRVVCFACDNALTNWDPNDDPLQEHKTWYPKCPLFAKAIPAAAPTPAAGPKAATKPRSNSEAMLNMNLPTFTKTAKSLNTYVQSLQRTASASTTVLLETIQSQQTLMLSRSQTSQESEATPTPSTPLARKGDAEEKEEMDVKDERSNSAVDGASESSLTPSLLNPGGDGGGEVVDSLGNGGEAAECLVEGPWDSAQIVVDASKFQMTADPGLARRGSMRRRKKETPVKDESMDLVQNITRLKSEIVLLEREKSDKLESLNLLSCGVQDEIEEFGSLQLGRLTVARTNLDQMVSKCERIIVNTKSVTDVWVKKTAEQIADLQRGVEEIKEEKHKLETEIAALTGELSGHREDLAKIRDFECVAEKLRRAAEDERVQIGTLEERKNSIVEEVSSLTEEQATLQIELADLRDTIERRRRELETFHRKLKSFEDREAIAIATETDLAHREKNMSEREKLMDSREEWVSRKDGEVRALESALKLREAKIKEKEEQMSRASQVGNHNLRFLDAAESLTATSVYSTPGDRELAKTVQIQHEGCQLPLWIPDDAVLACQTCNANFLFPFRIKHHCRICGKVCCDDCTGGGVLYSQINRIRRFGFHKPVRVCNQCKGFLDE